jgi:tetraprenyl-beta-curcumene synthase
VLPQPDVMPLNGPQCVALARAVSWHLVGGLRAAGREIHRWRQRAAFIPDPQLRRDALNAIDTKRGHADGAALFWTLAPHRSTALLRLLVAFELIYDFLDNVGERGADAGVEHGESLVQALADALKPHHATNDYYRHQPRSHDGGYLKELVAACRAGCAVLPSFAAVQAFLELEASRQPVLALNHDIDPSRRRATLQEWATANFQDDFGMQWYELTAAASQSIITFALLALAAAPSASAADAEAWHAAYFPWFAYDVTMLDAYVDQVEDGCTGAHSYIAYYPTRRDAVRRLAVGVRRAAESLKVLPHGERHGVLLGCMIALYLSKDAARTAEMRASTLEIASAGGTLTRTLVPVLRAWRLANGQRSKT